MGKQIIYTTTEGDPVEVFNNVAGDITISMRPFAPHPDEALVFDLETAKEFAQAILSAIDKETEDNE